MARSAEPLVKTSMVHSDSRTRRSIDSTYQSINCVPSLESGRLSWPRTSPSRARFLSWTHSLGRHGFHRRLIQIPSYLCIDSTRQSPSRGPCCPSFCEMGRAMRGYVWYDDERWLSQALQDNTAEHIGSAAQRLCTLAWRRDNGCSRVGDTASSIQFCWRSR